MKIFLLASLILPGCAWVTSSDLDERLPQLDDDGDGFTRDGGGDEGLVDCDDTNRDIHPGAEEVWYDGVDSNCLGDNDFDQDGDGFSSAEEATDGTDCDDLEATTNPEAEEIWYDGVDSDCLGDDDYDQDGDGFSSAAETTDGTDCDDLEAATNPGAEEIWYDGIDSDCLGDDDYDQDGDGHLSADEAPGGTDCDDLVATTNPEAEEIWYDGVDSDCLGDDDFDQDGDGYVSEAETTDGTDCLDTDASAYPGAMEDLSETEIDHDCDGSATSVGLDWQSAMNWTGIGTVRLGETTNRFYMSVVSESFTDSDSTTYYDLGVAPYWDNAAIAGEASDVVFWSSDDTVATTGRQTLTGHDMIFEDDHLYGVMGILDGNTRTIRLFRSDTNGTNDAASLGDLDPSDIENITLWRDGNNDYRFISCDTTTVGSMIYALTNEERLDGSLDGYFYHTTASGMGGPAGCVAQMTGTHSGSLLFANEGSGGTPSLYSLDTTSNNSSSLTFSIGPTEGGLFFRDLDFKQSSQGDSWVASAEYLTDEIGLYKNGDLQAIHSLSGSDAPLRVSLSHSSSSDVALAAWTSGTEHGLLWADGSGNTGMAELSLEIEATGIEVLLLSDGLHAVVIGHSEDAVEMALFKLF